MRVTVNVAGSVAAGNLPKVILLPDSLQQFLDDATQKLDMPQCARRAWTRDGEPIESISAIKDNQLVLVSAGSRFPGRRPSARSTASPEQPAPMSTSTPTRRTPMGALPAGAAAGSEARPSVTTPAVATDPQVARLRQASKRHAELVDSIRVGERLVRELRQQVEKLRNRSAEERQKVDTLRAQAAELSEGIVLKQSELDALASQAAAAPPPMIQPPAIADMSRADAGAASEQGQEQIRALEEALQTIDSQLQHTQVQEHASELAKAKTALAEERHAANELEQALRARDAVVAQANEAAARQQQSFDELEARLLKDVESRVSLEEQWQKERSQINENWQAKVERIQSECELKCESAEAKAKSQEVNARAESRDSLEQQWEMERDQINADWQAEVERIRSECELKCESAEANAKAAADAAAAKAGDQADMQLRLRAMEAAHEQEIKDLQTRHADDLTAVAEATNTEAQLSSEAKMREMLAQLQNDAMTKAETSAKNLADAQRKAQVLAVSAAKQEEDNSQQLAMARSEIEVLQVQNDSHVKNVAAKETEITVLKQKLDAVRAGLDEANEKLATTNAAAADAAVASTGAPQVALGSVSISPVAARDQGEQLVSVSKDRPRQAGKKAPTRGRPGRGGTRAATEPNSAIAPPPVIEEPVAVPASASAVAAPALMEAQSITTAKKTEQQAAVLAAKQRRASKQTKSSATKPGVVVVPGKTSAAEAAREASGEGGASAPGSHADAIKGNAVFLKMQAKLREAEAEEEAR